MLTLQDCIGMCDFSMDEIEAIAEHEHVPAIIAIGLAESLIQRRDDGMIRILLMITDDIDAAVRRGDSGEARRLEAVRQRFVETHTADLKAGVRLNATRLQR